MGQVFSFEFLRNFRILKYNHNIFEMYEKLLHNLTPHIFNKNIFINIYTHVSE